MRLSVNGQTTGFYLSRVPSDFDTAWQLEKFAADDGSDPSERVYHVLCTEGHSSCDCKGHQRHEHCRHASAVEALLRAGRIG
jgi:hypothetical protein